MERSIRAVKSWSWRTFFFQWEWLLVLIFIAVNVVNSTLSPYYFSVDTFLGTPMSFLDKAFLVLPMTMVIILGNIDISVGSSVCQVPSASSQLSVNPTPASLSCLKHR